jgi:hydroxymethylglutaryl-CoA lyase
LQEKLADKMNDSIKLIECPRDAIQGIHDFIPTDKKIKYINYLLSLGIFDTIDFGSFVSPKAIPQMADTHEVVKGLDLSNSSTKLLTIIANERGAIAASDYEQISYLGYPFSVSETFQIRNTNATIEESVKNLQKIQEICVKSNKKLVVYLSMAFGNPYNDIWNSDIVLEWIEKLQVFDIEIFSLSDTIGVASVESIDYLCKNIIPKYKNLEIGVHLHTETNSWKEKIEAALKNGCLRFDGAMLGYGGCPMAQDELVGNMPMEKLLEHFARTNMDEINDLKKMFGEMIM